MTSSPLDLRMLVCYGRRWPTTSRPMLCELRAKKLNVGFFLSNAVHLCKLEVTQ